MTRDEILRTTESDFEKLFAVWTENMDQKGLGALVFAAVSDSPLPRQYRCTYLTLSELRDYLRRISGNDGLVYRWVKQAQSARGIPIVIVPPDQPAAT
jgi:hypothetical protein